MFWHQRVPFRGGFCHWKDLIIGADIQLLGRKIYLCACNNFTRVIDEVQSIDLMNFSLCYYVYLRSFTSIWEFLNPLMNPTQTIRTLLNCWREKKQSLDSAELQNLSYEDK